MGENIVLVRLEDLHKAIYDLLSTINTVSGLVVSGFDSGKTDQEIAKIGMKVGLDSLQVDRSRPAPTSGNRLEIPSGNQADLTYEGTLYQGVYLERTLRYPLPVVLIYNVWTWSYSSRTALAMDQALLMLLPERGVLNLAVGTPPQDGEFPIELVTIQNLDDLENNVREKIYQYRIEAWIEGSLPDEQRDIITIPTFESYKGEGPEDALQKNLVDTYKLEPE